MRMTRLGVVLSLCVSGTVWAGAKDKKLDVYWVDSEGGGSTLIVTPAGESVLIDTGFPGERDANRIAAAAKAAGLKRIDHVLVTHFHIDHFGGTIDLAKKIPLGTIWDNGIASAPDKERNDPLIAAYQAVKADARATYKPGESIPLKSAKGAAPLALRVLAARKELSPAPDGARPNALCSEHKDKAPDASDNANSAVFVLDFGPFRFFDGGDLTWNVEGQLVCPSDRVGEVDVYQTNHHGLDQSNNPVLVKTLAPTVAVANNGPKKGGEPGAMAILGEIPSIKAIYQVHKNVRPGAKNWDDAQIANKDEACKGDLVKMHVAADGRSYTVDVPSTKHTQTFETRAKAASLEAGLLPVGAPAPALAVTAHDGTAVDLKKLRGKNVVIYFYPKDDTPGCTKQACSIRDAWGKLESAGVVVLGVSTQGVESHKAFAEKHKLPFRLLPDEDAAIAKAFWVPTSGGLAKRVTYLIGKNGKIAKVWPKANPETQAEDILAEVGGKKS